MTSPTSNSTTGATTITITNLLSELQRKKMSPCIYWQRASAQEQKRHETG